MTEERDGSRIKEYIKDHGEELYELLLQLAQIPAPSGREEKRARFCLRWLREQGAVNAWQDEAGNIIWPYRDDGECPLILFAAHMDVVFPDEEPLPLYEEDGKIFCPGVGDDTANLAVLLMMAKYCLNCHPDTAGRGFLFVCDTGEEGLGNLRGAREICRRFGDRTEAFFALDLTMDDYTAKAVGSLRYQVTVTAKGGHSYSDFGNVNANAVLAEVICRIYQMEVPEKGHTTFNVGVISGGTSVNTIAQRAEMLCEVRSDDAGDLAMMKERMENIFREFQKSGKTSPKRQYGEMGRTEKCRESLTGSRTVPEGYEEGPTGGEYRLMVQLIGERPCEQGVDETARRRLFRLVEQSVEAVCGKIPVPVSCSTDCNIPLSMGIPSVCIGTCRGEGAHTREEYIWKDSLPQGLEIALLLLEQCVLS